MKIIDRKTFLALPPETLFSKYSPAYFGELYIKGETVHGDFYCSDFTTLADFDSSDEAISKTIELGESGESFSFDLNEECRDGMFDEDQRFAVWERKDVEQLIWRLSRCLPIEKVSIHYLQTEKQAQAFADKNFRPSGS